MGNCTILWMFENPRRGRQARNFPTNAPKILDLKSSSEQIFSRKLPLGAPDFLTKPESKGTVKAEGKAVNRGGGYGMEVPCVYRFTGQQKYVEMLRNLFDLQNNLSVRNVHKTDETLKRAKEQEGSRVKKTKLC